MILTCPSCATRYTLPDSQLPAGGRTVRCAACKSTWHAEKSEDPIELPLPIKAAPVRPEELADVKPAKLPGQYRAMVEDKKRLKELTAQGIVWGVMAASVVILLAVGFFLRVDIVRAFPRIAGAYAMVGVPVNASQLEIHDDFTADITFKNGRFQRTVTARITNLVDKPTPVPPVKATLYDSTGQIVDQVIIPSAGLVVEPGATRTLNFDVPDPKNMSASGGLRLSFDLEAMKKTKPGAGKALRGKASDGHGGDTHDDGAHPTPASEDSEHESAGHDAEHAVTEEAPPAAEAAGHAELPVTPGLRSGLPSSEHDTHSQTKPAATGHEHS